MNNIVFQFKERTNTSKWPLTLWAFIVAGSLFSYELNESSHGQATRIGLLATILLGVYLGWNRRLGATFVAPFVSWFIAWPPLWLATMIQEGFVKGLFKGLFIITFGWIVIGGAEFIVLFTTSAIVRVLRGKRGQAEPEIVIFGPDEY